MAFEWTLPGATLRVPGGAIVGLLTDDSAALSALIDAARKSGVHILDRPSLSHLERVRAASQLETVRRAGTPVLIASWDEEWLNLCDELWWLGPDLVRKGHPRELLPLLRKQALQILHAQQRTLPLPPLFRRGDGRARLIAITPVDGGGEPTSVWRVGEDVGVDVRVEFQAPVDDPVIGIMIRTRTGMEVYGTNTELENLRLGPVIARQELTLRFRFACHLCPQMFTITAASHDPEGVWHDWAEDAVAVMVSSGKYAAGVVNLAARVSVRQGGAKK